MSKRALYWPLTWSRWSDLNRRPTDYESIALPLSYIGLLTIPTTIQHPIRTKPQKLVRIENYHFALTPHFIYNPTSNDLNFDMLFYST